MACEVDHDGEAQVSDYFDPTVRDEGTSSGVQNGESGTEKWYWTNLRSGYPLHPNICKYAIFPYCSLYIFHATYKENLRNNQELFEFTIIYFILLI